MGTDGAVVLVASGILSICVDEIIFAIVGKHLDGTTGCNSSFQVKRPCSSRISMNFESCWARNRGAVKPLCNHHSNKAVDLSGTENQRRGISCHHGAGNRGGDGCGDVDHQVHNARLRSVTKRISGSNRNLVFSIRQGSHGGASTPWKRCGKIYGPSTNAIGSGGVDQVVNDEGDGAISFDGASNGRPCVTCNQVTQYTGITYACKSNHGHCGWRGIHGKGKHGAIAGDWRGSVACDINRADHDIIIAISKGFQEPGFGCVITQIDRPVGRLQLVFQIQIASHGFIKGGAVNAPHADNG